jgi:hypothetical protein
MANIKQKYIKPGRDFNYSEGVKVKATEAVYQDQVVYVDGSSGPFLTVSIADANAAGEFLGRLMVAKHDIAAGSYGIVLPWKLVKDFDTSGAAAVNSPVYLSATTGTSRASNLTFTAPTGSNQIIVGRVTVDNTAALGGAMMICPSAPELSVTGGYATAGAGTGIARQTITFPCLFPGTGGATINFTGMPVPIILVDAYMIAGNNSEPVLTVLEAANLAITCLASGAATGAVGRASVIAHGNCDIAAGGTLRLTKTNGHAEDIAIITAIYG